MRVLLINPYYPISETPSPPLGLAYLASALSEAGIEVKILDLVVSPYSQSMLRNVLEQFKPQIAGLTAVSMTFNFAIDVIQDIRHLCPDILTIMGGPHASFCARETLQRFPGLDIVVLGEGEQTVVELTRAVDNGRRWEGVKGIAYRSGSDIRCTAERALIADLDSLPVPARHLLPLGRYRALGMPVSLTTSRGCPFKCIFCVGRKMVGARVRYRSPAKVVDELEYLNSLNFHQINIADDLFTANKHHCSAVCDEIIKRRLKLIWTSFARVDTVSEEVLVRMKAAGCSAVSFGVESGNPQILKTIKKGITREQVVAAVNMCRRTGITPFASFILGLPGETPQTIQETLDFGEQLKDLGLSFGFHLLAPFPGTEIRANSHQYGIKILTDDWSQYHANRAIVETASVDRQMLNHIVITWENEYNQLLADIKLRMHTAEASPEEVEQLTNLERIVLVYDLMMKEAVEQKGFWSNDGRPMSTEQSLRTLCDRVGSMVDADPQLLHDTLSRALQQGNLNCSDANGRTRWQWVDHI
jgi:anaerobic magnesium-protoporphyrin IX monomethyl ester cyclase